MHSLQGQIVEHTAGAEDPAVAGREYRRDDDDIDNIRCAGDAEFSKVTTNGDPMCPISFHG